MTHLILFNPIEKMFFLGSYALVCVYKYLRALPPAPFVRQIPEKKVLRVLMSMLCFANSLL